MTIDNGVLQLTQPLRKVTSGLACSARAVGRAASASTNRCSMEERTSSIAARKHDAWEPEWIYGTFTVSGRCENPRCGTVFAGAGSYSIDYSENREVEYGEDGPHYSGFYRCEQLYPQVLLLTVPESTPPDVQLAIHRAGRVHPLRPRSCRDCTEARGRAFPHARGHQREGRERQVRLGGKAHQDVGERCPWQAGNCTAV